jgi:hypothetical protein
MAKLQVAKGTTSKLIDVFIQDSSSTTGSGLAGLVYNSASLVAYYYREGAASATAITLATMTLGTWATGGFIAVDGTNMPGVYQLGLPNTALAAGANSVVVMMKGAANMAPVVLEIQLTDDTSGTVNINSPVKRNTALANFTFLMVDTAGLAKTGLTVLSYRSLDGAAFAATTNAATELAFGVYKIDLAAGDLNAVNVCLRFTAAGARDSIISILTIP